MRPATSGFGGWPTSSGAWAPTCAADEDLARPVLDAERLDAYRVALEFQAVAGRLVPRWERVIYDQFQRASLSIVLNIAEGGGRRSRRDKAKYYGIARGSAAETAAILDVAALRGLAPLVECRRGKALLVRVISMLTRMQEALA